MVSEARWTSRPAFLLYSFTNTLNRSLRVSPILVTTGYRCFLVWFDLVMPFIIHQRANARQTLPSRGSAFNGRSQKEGARL
jgi:hypothetical protein